MTDTSYKKYRLSIQLSLGGFSFLVINPETQEILEEKDFKVDLEQSFFSWLKIKFATGPLLREKYERAVVLFIPQKYTLVPTNLFREDKKTELFKVAHNLESSEVLCSEQTGDITVLYALSSELLDIFNNFLPQIKWTTLPSYEIRDLKESKNWVLKVQVLKDTMFVNAFSSGNLQFSNSFYCAKTIDNLYYILYCIEKLDINLDESTIMLEGDSRLVEELYENIKKYHPQIELPTPALGIESKIPLGNILISNIL